MQGRYEGHGVPGCVENSARIVASAAEAMEDTCLHKDGDCCGGAHVEDFSRMLVTKCLHIQSLRLVQYAPFTSRTQPDVWTKLDGM